jgi:hypothetical protein
MHPFQPMRSGVFRRPAAIFPSASDSPAEGGKSNLVNELREFTETRMRTRNSVASTNHRNLTSQTRPLTQLSDDARLLTRIEAARYLSISVGAFDDWIRRGLVPRPIPSTRRWDRRAIDAALDALSGVGFNQQNNALDVWINGNAHPSQRNPQGKGKAR